MTCISHIGYINNPANCYWKSCCAPATHWLFWASSTHQQPNPVVSRQPLQNGFAEQLYTTPAHRQWCNLRNQLRNLSLEVAGVKDGYACWLGSQIPR